MTYKILIVDDEMDLRDLLTTFLTREGFETEVAANGKEAFDKIQQLHPHLVISDIRMPVWDGFELLRNVTKLGVPRTPMLFISGFAPGDSTVLKDSPNFAGFMAKPVRRQTLIDAVKAILAKSEAP